MGQTTIIIMILTIISKLFGFIRESVMAAFIGAGELKSIYTTATTIPTMLANVISLGIVSGFIPIYNKAKNEGGEERANIFTSNLINIILIYGVVALSIIFIFAGPICKILSPDLAGDSLKLAINFTRIVIFSLFALLYSSIIKGYLNIKGNFVDPASTGIILNIFIIISTILTGIFKNPYILVVGTFLAFTLQYVRFPFVAKKLGFKYIKKLDFSDAYVRSMLIIGIPVIISSAADHISVLIDNSMASAFFGVSSVSKMFYAKTMLNFIMGVVTISVTTATFPEIAKLGQSGKIKEMKDKTISAVVLSMLLVIPATFGMMALSNPIIKLAFERNAFTTSDTDIVASVLVSYGPYIIFSSLIKILANAFYSVRDSKTPVIILLIQQIINLIMNIILSKIFGLNGLAYSTSVATLICSVLLFISFRKKLGDFKLKTTIKSLLKISIVSFLICIIARLSFEFFISTLPLILSITVSVLLAGVIYLIGIILLKIPEFNYLISSVKKKISKK
ncbi:murein biosynthesis integral membrane protein MurJ [Anaerococcus sp. AGMB00486]|uniref:Probable lipid II flippase MurJ n=1 Tax=Anaerococcus faecalis TaxID=2742993 RepID=A0ABX2NA45_9FIRM|nr:murein biosynthesis integral membrane protein MurJ [Anaerococcus faecalis]NVF11529.1 murein biosynthesis integral membrane protein MurJ [Anaerococcus faecalis]